MVHSSLFRKSRNLVLGSVIGLALISANCRTRPAQIPSPKPDPRAEAYAQAAKFAAEGDDLFRQDHLYGWRQAEARYAKAYQLASSDELQQKLLLTRFLILTRQIDEDIPYSRTDETIQELCSDPQTQKALCEIAKWYRNKNDRQPDIKPLLTFMEEVPPLKAYFQRLLPDGNSGDLSARDNATADQLRDSPLFIYLTPWRFRTKDPAEFQKDYSLFAEGFERIAESLFEKKRYSSARLLFQKALELIPDYTRAMNGLANICFFALEDCECALAYYESALKFDPTNIAALFGKGAALHRSGRYEESNAALDRLLSRDLRRDPRLDNAGYRYYSGEGYYVKGYNYYLLKDSTKARELVDVALSFLPDSEEVNDFSGILFFEARKMEEARKSFLKVVAKGNASCSALFHLGLIYQKMNGPEPMDTTIASGAKEYVESSSLRKESSEKKALNYFLGAGSCAQTSIATLSSRIDSVPALDLDPTEKTFLTARLKNKLADLRFSSSLMIDTIEKAISDDATPGTESYLKMMKEIGSQIRGQ